MIKYVLEATFADGTVATDDGTDTSLFVEGRNFFHDILNKHHEAEHGPMTKFSIVSVEPPIKRHSVDWTKLPANARPIFLHDRELDISQDGTAIGEARTVRFRFGYQYTNEQGQNKQVIKEIL